MATMEIPQPHTSSRPSTATKTAGLGNILNSDGPPAQNGAPQLRDSGFYSTAEASSKHTSAASFSVNGLSPTTSGFSSADKTPSPVAASRVPQTVVSPITANMSVASMVSPTAPSGLRTDRPNSTESGPPAGATLGESLAYGPGSRRESVDSRINQGISDMRLGNSPYASNNHSTTSIQNALHNQRNPRAGSDSLAVHRISNGYQPSHERNPEPKSIRTAPAITGPATGTIARAAEPTKGQAWAFPEEEIQRLGPPHSYDDSRRSSVTESIASSQYTTESRLPPGQRRLDESPEYGRIPSVSGEFPPVHHHSMQHKQLSDLQAEEINGPNAAQPYSRTPELRVSHKLAERKRRTEMKELFDQLRDLMPQERGSKASKWEILTKAIAEHQKQGDHLRALQTHYANAAAENEALRREMQAMRMDIAQLRGELHSSAAHSSPPQQQSQQQSSQQGPPPASQGSHHGSYASDHYANSNRTELPPLRSISSDLPPGGPDSMTGVQYEGSRANGYRPERY